MENSFILITCESNSFLSYRWMQLPSLVNLHVFLKVETVQLNSVFPVEREGKRKSSLKQKSALVIAWQFSLALTGRSNGVWVLKTVYKVSEVENPSSLLQLGSCKRRWMSWCTRKGMMITRFQAMRFLAWLLNLRRSILDLSILTMTTSSSVTHMWNGAPFLLTNARSILMNQPS